MAATGQQEVPALYQLSWDELQIILEDEASSDLQRLMARHLIDGLRQQSRFLTPGGRLREIAVIILAVTDPLQDGPGMSVLN